MRFPIANISIRDWNPQEDFEHYILMDPYIYTKNEDFFRSFYKDHEFVDSEGNIFKVVDKRPPRSCWRRLFHFLPDVFRISLVFIKTGEKMEMEEIREFVLKQISRVKRGDNLSGWMEHVRKAGTIHEILGGS